jgi:hypothetical protein
MSIPIVLVVPFNLPKFCSNASWHPNATTVTNSSMLSSNPAGIFIDTNNVIYVVDQAVKQIVIWSEGGNSPTRIISGGFNNAFGLFVSIAGDIYVDNGYSNGQVDKWTSNATNSTSALYVSASCYGLFIDIQNNLYCSSLLLQQVVKGSLNSGVKTSTIVAGTGCIGASSNMLYNPSGIFVDNNLNLYVADSGNNRVQMFASGQLSGTTVAGNGYSNPITLYWPSEVMLDGDGYLYIVDSNNNRVVGSGPSGFRCLVGCSGTSGSRSDQFNRPFSMRFDSYGNMFVTDALNYRVQKFLLATGACGKCDHT